MDIHQDFDKLLGIILGGMTACLLVNEGLPLGETCFYSLVRVKAIAQSSALGSGEQKPHIPANVERIGISAETSETMLKLIVVLLWRGGCDQQIWQSIAAPFCVVLICLQFSYPIERIQGSTVASEPLHYQKQSQAS